MFFLFAVCVVLARSLGLVVSLHMFAGGCDSLVGVGLRRERDEGYVGDLVHGLSAYLGDMFAGGDRYEEQGRCDFEQPWSRYISPRSN